MTTEKASHITVLVSNDNPQRRRRNMTTQIAQDIKDSAKIECVSQAEMIAGRAAGDASRAVELAELTAIATDQDWDNGATAWVFDDGSRITVSGDEIAAAAEGATVYGYAAIGTDGTRPVVWGLGRTEEEAEREARMELTELGEDTNVERVVPVTEAQYRRINAGDVSAEGM